MGRLRRLQTGQKVSIVIGLATALAIVGLYVATRGFSDGPTGWFGYPPGSNPTKAGADTYFIVRHLSATRLVLIPLALVAAWTGFASWLFGSPAHPSAEPNE